MQTGRRKAPRAEPSGAAAACFAGSAKSTESLPAAVSPPLVAARLGYLKALRAAVEAEQQAARMGGFASKDVELARSLAQEEHYAREASDLAFGVLARLAHAEGYRACLCGKLEKEKKR